MDLRIKSGEAARVVEGCEGPTCMGCNRHEERGKESCGGIREVGKHGNGGKRNTQQTEQRQQFDFLFF